MISRCLLFLVLAIATGGCAFLNRDNTPLVNAVERNLVPESTGGKILTAPVVVPVGVGAGVLDVFVVHPISVIPDSAHDTYNVLWKHRDHGYVTRMGSTIPLAVLTPVVFVFDFLGRSMFDFHPYRYRAPIDRLSEEEKAALGRTSYEDLRQALARKDKKWLDAWFDVAESEAQPDRSEEVRLVFEEAAWDYSLQARAHQYLVRIGRLAGNEEYLVNLVRNGKAGPHEQNIQYALSAVKSRLLSRYWLDKMTRGNLTPADAQSAVGWIFRIGNKDDVDEVLRRLRQPPVPPKP